MTRWLHPRRGVIEGEIVGNQSDETWMHIRLTADAPRASLRARGHGPIDEAGEVITVRRDFVRELP
jgi:hypothetical protein